MDFQLERKEKLLFYLASITLSFYSFYLHFETETFIEFIIFGSITSALLIFSLKILTGVRPSTLLSLKSAGKIIVITLLISLAWAGSIYADLRQYNDYCSPTDKEKQTNPGLVGSNRLTGIERNYCNFTPWYTKAVCAHESIFQQDKNLPLCPK